MVINRRGFLGRLLAACSLLVAEPIISHLGLESLVSEADARPPHTHRRKSRGIDVIYRSIVDDERINTFSLEQQIELFISRLRKNEQLNKADQTSIYVYDLECVEYIGKLDGRTYRNKTSAHDLNIFMNQLYKRNIVSKAASHRMLEIMAGYRTSIFYAIKHKGVKIVAGKTGHVGGLTGESAILYYKNHAGQYRQFVLTAMIENNNMKNASGETKRAWANKTNMIVRRISDLVVFFYQRDLPDIFRDRSSFNQRVKDYEQHYLEQGIKNEDNITRKRGREYVDTIKTAAEKFDLDWRDLYSLIFIESDFREHAFSSTGPLGIAQLNYDTGILNGLKIDSRAKGNPCGRYRDERCNPTKAIYAAARQLNRLYHQALDNLTVNPAIAWINALASYNSGFAATEKLLEDQKEIDYRFLELTPEQKEYNDYVPRILAVRNIIF